MGSGMVVLNILVGLAVFFVALGFIWNAIKNNTFNDGPEDK